jgi:hypothetical protein
VDNGGQAFPVPAANVVHDNIHYAGEGMTLRDYFAAKAMQAMYAGDGARMVASSDALRRDQLGLHRRLQRLPDGRRDAR